MTFSLLYALRSLRRDSTRTFLAGLSVAFGVLSLVAMQLVSNTLLHGALFDSRLQLGGEAKLYAASFDQPLNAAELGQIETWKKQGIIARAAPLAQTYDVYLRTPGYGRVTILQHTTGLDPSSYPLVGDLILSAPAGATPADVLRAPADALITRDIADQRGLKTGDRFTLTAGGAPLTLTVAGIIEATPNQQGLQVFYSLDTARQLENRPDVINEVAVLLGDAPDAVAALRDSPYTVFFAGTRDEMMQNQGTALFDMMLKGAGVLGLLVGGLGVMNTLQVILARRRLEIAMLKTVGFRREQLLLLIGIETGLIGLVGGLSGALLGSLIARALLDTLGSTGLLMIRWSPDGVVVLGGIAAGFLTAVVFGLQAILASSATRPVALLREQPRARSMSDTLAQLVLYGVLLLLFGLLIGLVLGSPLLGIAYIIGGGLLLLALRTVLWIVLWGITRLPAPLPILRLARASLRSRKTQASLVLLALFAGAFAVTFAAVAISNAQLQSVQRHGDEAGFNLAVLTTTDRAGHAAELLKAQGASSVYQSMSIPAAVDHRDAALDGRTTADLADITYTGKWDEQAAVGLLPASEAERYKTGDTIVVQANGHEQAITITGFYRLTDPRNLAARTSGLIVPAQIAKAFAGEHTQMRVMGQFPVGALDAAATTLGAALPDDLVFSQVDLDHQLDANFRALFTFAISIASLAFVAGAVLIANAAGLTIVERRREIGVLKAVGYTSNHVLRVFVTEYGFLGGLAGIAGIVGVVIAISLVNQSPSSPNLVIDPAILGGMLLLSIGIALVSAIIVVFPPTRVRPLDVLRYE
jgi:putative ABC transport system permease protein